MKRDDITAATLAGLMETERQVLGWLAEAGPLDPLALAQALDCSISYAASVLRGLEAAGLVSLVWQPGRRRPWHGLSPALQQFTDSTDNHGETE